MIVVIIIYNAFFKDNRNAFAFVSTRVQNRDLLRGFSISTRGLHARVGLYICVIYTYVCVVYTCVCVYMRRSYHPSVFLLLFPREVRTAVGRRGLSFIRPIHNGRSSIRFNAFAFVSRTEL